MFSFAELRAIAKAIASNGMIEPGERYYCQTNTDEGRVWSWRAKPAIHAICQRLDLYDYEY